jgi:hypothetical protein
MALIQQKAERRLPMDRHPVEWLLFLLVAVLSFRAAWIVAEGHTYDFFWQAYDGLGYYQWLPSAFITGKFDWMFWCKKIGDFKALSMYSLGVSVLQLPFFLSSQVLTWFFGYPNTGFSPPNAVFMMASTAFYAGSGAVLSFKLARGFSNTSAALLAVVSIYAASNLFYYAVREPLMSHVYSYFLIALFCWCSLRIIDGPRNLHVVLFLFSGALLLLVRQLNGIVFVFPLWMAWTSPGGIRGAWGNLMGHRGAGIIGLALGLVPWLLQGAYWHDLTGHWYVNPYTYAGEYFEWGKAVPGMVLFSPRNGWFAYSPIFLLAVGALLVGAWRNRHTARPVLLILVLTVLVYSAWWCWWLGGGYGYRGLVDLYALFAIPLAWFFRWVLRKGWPMRVITALLLWSLVRLNFGMMEHWNFDVFCVDAKWPPLMHVIGQIAAGN